MLGTSADLWIPGFQDVASHFYSYSFALNPDWSRKFSLRPEIQAYFRNVAEQSVSTFRVIIDHELTDA